MARARSSGGTRVRPRPRRVGTQEVAAGAGEGLLAGPLVLCEAVASAVARLLAEPSSAAAAGRRRDESAGMPAPGALERDELGALPASAPR